MIIALGFISALAAIGAVWLWRQGLGARPWLETGHADEVPAAHGLRVPAAKLGLGLFIVVATSMLALLASAYAMRMEMADWRPPPQPRLLWINTGLLVLSSLALHFARAAARRKHLEGIKDGLGIAGATAVLFLLGQVLAWRQFAASGYLLRTNPADAFFYVITAAHALHLAGGLVALGRTGARSMGTGTVDDRLRLAVELCATYWHFLLLAWIGLFGLLAFSSDIAWLYTICTAPFR